MDLLHPVISGNKWFKLKNYLQQAQQTAANSVITFGGPWSNHLIATAFAAREAGFDAVGIVRGERPPVLSSTLSTAIRYGMKLEFISRKDYAGKTSPDFLNRLSLLYPGAYIIPEGGAGPLGILGSEDILRMIDASSYTHIVCAIGTGTMFRGLISGSLPGQIVIGVPVLNGSRSLLHPHSGTFSSRPPAGRLSLRWLRPSPKRTHRFINEFYRETAIPSDIVYTGKLFYALRDSIRRAYFPDSSRILVIHSGGLQGNGSLKPGTLEF